MKGEPVALRRLEYRVLAAHPADLVTSEELLAELWGRRPKEAQSRTLSVRVTHLRAAVEAPSDYNYVHTVVKFGYRFMPLRKGSAEGYLVFGS